MGDITIHHGRETSLSSSEKEQRKKPESDSTERHSFDANEAESSRPEPSTGHRSEEDKKPVDLSDEVDEQSLKEAKVVLKYFTGFKEILWFDQKEGIKDIVITRPMELIKSMRTIINHETAASIMEGSPRSSSGTDRERGLLSFEEFEAYFDALEESYAFAAEELWIYLKELGLAFPLKAFEPSYTTSGDKELYLLPCLITDQTGQSIQRKYQEMRDSTRSTMMQYTFDHIREGTEAFQDLIKAFIETFLWNGRGGKILNAFNQKVEERKLGVISGFHGILRWSTSEDKDSDELFEFLILHHLSKGDPFQQSISIHLKTWDISRSSQLAISVLMKKITEFLPGTPAIQREFQPEVNTMEEEPEKCPICLETSLTEPVVTDCAHMICWPCLINNRSTSESNGYECPMCRQTYKIVTSVNRKGNEILHFCFKLCVIQEV